MTRMLAPIRWLCCGLALLMAVSCTGGGGVASDQRYLIRVGSRQLSLAAFNRIFEISKTAYSHNDLRDPVVRRDIKLRLLNQLLEEMILLEKAAEAGITVSGDELQTAVKQIKADYPEGVFEEMLLESAVSFEDWQERLRIRLLTHKVIDTLIASSVVITPEDIQAYVEGHRQELSQAQDGENGDQVNAMILRRLRESKTERL